MDNYFANKIEEERRKIERFFHGKKYKTLNQSMTFLKRYFQNFEQSHFAILDDKLKKQFNYESMFKPLSIILILPYDSTSIQVSISDAKRINVTRAYYESKFKEKPIKFRFYDEEQKQVSNGPDIIVSTLPLDAIFISINGEDQSLKSLSQY